MRIAASVLACFLCILLRAQAVGDYQSAASGNWSTVGTWQTWNGSAWVAAATAPTSANGTITIQSGHVVNITAAVTVDQVVVNGSVNLKNVALTINNGTGDDLIINGSFEDSSNTTVAFGTAAWSMAAGATLIRCGSGGANIWQTSYSGGIAGIPSTANWIIRKSGTASPAISTISAYYPNLTIENKTGTNWYTTTSSTFTGSGGYPTIKGNLNIGGTQTGTVDFLNDCQNAQATLVQGNVTVKSGSRLRNWGTGLEVQGNLTVNGDINYNGGTGARKLIFSGSNNQTVSGTGVLNVYDLVVNKSSNTVTLSRAMTVDDNGTFTAGTMTTSSAFPLVFSDNATVTSPSGTSFVNGPVRRYDNGVSGNFTYPVGKNSDYQAIGMSGSPGTAFWTEAFSNGCSSACGAATYTGPNGPWTVTSTGTNSGTCNVWYISYQEDGNAQGQCGSAATNLDPSLHIGSQSSGDIGAAYDAGGACGIFYCVTTNWRAESPTINCTGRSNILVSFNYLEFGDGSNDNGTMWYYDGATWSQLVDLPKTYCCGGVCNNLRQGLWQTYRIALPASANGNANVKIGFNWTNNDDGVGTDPSFAIDDITLTDNYWTAEYFYANPQVVYNNNLAPTLNSIDACEYWLLDRNAASGSKSVTLTWDGNSCPAIPTITDTRVAHFDLNTTTIWQDEGNGGNTGTIAAGTVTSAAPVTYFSPFTIGLIPPTPLPVELLQFTGVCDENAVHLNWSTASELNNDYFSIERSSDGNTFSEIGRVDGAGNSDQLLRYTFDDASAQAGVSYYRIRQVDFNGQYSVSKLISVDASICREKNLTLFSSTFSENNLDLAYGNAAAPVTIEIYSAEGRLLYRAEQLPAAAQQRIACDSWPGAVYFIVLTDGAAAVHKTLVK